MQGNKTGFPPETAKNEKEARDVINWIASQFNVTLLDMGRDGYRFRVLVGENGRNALRCALWPDGAFNVRVQDTGYRGVVADVYAGSPNRPWRFRFPRRLRMLDPATKSHYTCLQ